MVKNKVATAARMPTSQVRRLSITVVSDGPGGGAAHAGGAQTTSPTTAATATAAARRTRGFEIGGGAGVTVLLPGRQQIWWRSPTGRAAGPGRAFLTSL